MPDAPLQCTVRGCRRGLERHARAWTCGAGHAFDVARSGYVNLLQPQDRKSSVAGDAAHAVEARSRLLAEGIGRTVIDGILALPEISALSANDVVADLGCGAGELLAALAAGREAIAIGLDLSTAAIAAAVRRAPDVTWVVVNVDRGIPLADKTASLLISLHARRNPSESRRVLRQSGRLVVAVPAADDLIELRHEVLGQGVERDRTPQVLAEHAGHFTLERQTVIRDRQRLERAALLDLLQGTYRGARDSAEVRVAQISSLAVTLASDVLIFRPV